MEKDYYRILQVKPDASMAEIRISYRRLLRLYHPDTGNGENVDAFLAVREAWAVLGNAQKRTEYDRQRAFAMRARTAASAASTRETSAGSPWTDPPPKTQKRARADFQGLFRRIFRERYQRPAKSPTEAVDGRDIQVRVELDLETAFRGGRRSIRLPADVHHPAGQVVEVDIPAGARHEQVLRFPAQGFPGVAGGRSGDLLVKVLLRPSARLQLDGKDLLYRLPVWPWELMLGAERNIEVLGERLRVQIAAGTQARTRLRLHGKGFGPEPRGDLLVILEVETPAPDSKEKRQALLRLARLYQQP